MDIEQVTKEIAMNKANPNTKENRNTNMLATKMNPNVPNTFPRTIQFLPLEHV